MNGNHKFYLAAALGVMLLTGGLMLPASQAYADEDTGAPPPPPPFCKVKLPEKKKEEPKAGATADATKPEGEAATPTAPAKPEIYLLPELQATCADGKFDVVISARLHGWQIGDTIPVAFRFTAMGGAVLNMDSVKQGKLALAQDFKQSFETAGPPEVRVQKQGDVTVYEYIVQVRQFEILPYINFSMQLPYSVANQPDGSPQWQIFTTPTYTMLNNIDGGYEVPRPMTMGNTELAKPRTPAAVPALSIAILLLILSWPAVWLMRRVNRTRPRKNISREAAAWLAMHNVVTSAKEIGFGAPHYTRIDEVLRKYLGTFYPGLEGMTMTEIEALPDEPRANIAKSVFRKLDGALFSQRTLTAAERAQLLKELDQLIKRPYTM